MHGLTKNTINQIRAVLTHNKKIKSAKIFGSRSVNKHKRGSDVDIAIIGEHITSQDIYQISDQLNEQLLLPYYFDIVDYNRLNNPTLIAHINKDGVEIYHS